MAFYLLMINYHDYHEGENLFLLARLDVLARFWCARLVSKLMRRHNSTSFSCWLNKLCH